MIIALFIVGFSAIGLATGLVAASSAPVGYQDETGFHYGPEHVPAQVEVARATPQPKFALAS